MSSTFNRDQWKPLDSPENHPQPFDLGLLSAGQLAAYSHSKALTEALRNDPRTDEDIARHAGMSKGYLSKWRSGLWQEHAGRLVALLAEVGHVGPVQMLAYELGYMLKPLKGKAKRAAS